MKDLVEGEFGVVEDLLETKVMVVVGMRDDHVIDQPWGLLGLRGVEVGSALHVAATQIVAPAEKAFHVGTDAGVDQDDLVIRSDDMATIALTDVNEIDLERASFCHVGLTHPALVAAASDLDEIPVSLVEEAQPIPKDQVSSVPHHFGAWRAR